MGARSHAGAHRAHGLKLLESAMARPRNLATYGKPVHPERRRRTAALAAAYAWGIARSFVAAQHSNIDVENRIRVVQTLLDRLIFVAFAEDKLLLPPRSLNDAVETTNKYNPQSKWAQLRTLFKWVDEGAPPHNIPRYNGGLFRRDTLIDGLDLPDHLVEKFGLLGKYDFASDVSVNILGHIFEQSISDIENEKAAAGIEAPPPAPKKKREGVV